MEYFELHNELLLLQEGNAAFEHEFLIPEHEEGAVDDSLDDIIVQLVQDSTNIILEENYGKLKSFVKYFDALTLASCSKLLDILVDRLCDQISQTQSDLKENGGAAFDDSRIALEQYSFLLHWAINAAEARCRSEKKEKAVATAPVKGKGKVKKSEKVEGWAWDDDRRRAFDALASMLGLDLHRVIPSGSERETLTSMITKSVSIVFEDPENLKSASTKQSAFQILAICAAKYDTDISKNTLVRIANFLKEEHLAEPVAELLRYAIDKYELPSLADNVLRESKNWEFSDGDQKQSKAFAKFLVRASELIPDRCIKQMVYLQSHMDSDSYTVRMAMLEVFGNLIHNSLSTNQSEVAFGQILSFFSVFEERFRDSKSFVRAKLLQVLTRLAERRDVGVTDIPLEKWRTITSLAIGRLHDKTSTVRKNAIKLLTQMIESSPYLMIASDLGRQNLGLFERKKKELDDIIKEKFPNELPPVVEGEDDKEDQDEADKATEKPQSSEIEQERVGASRNEALASEADLLNLRKFQKYYSDGIKFFKQIKGAAPTLCDLMNAKTKTEVIEAMKFFVCAHSFDMECAREGIRAMIHKVWDKDPSGSDDGAGSIRDNLINCFSSVYLEARLKDRDHGEREEVIVANHLIKLVQDMNLAELTSLEHLLGAVLAKDLIQNSVIDVLWTVFTSKRKEMASSRRRAALIILSMLGRTKSEIISEKKDLILRFGLGEFAKTDMLLARQSCVALQQLGCFKRKKGALSVEQKRIPMNDVLFMRLCQLILEPCASPLWFGLTEQALNAIFLLAEHPDRIGGFLLKQMTARVFQLIQPEGAVDEITNSINRNFGLTEATVTPPVAPSAEASGNSDGINTCPQTTASAFELSKLCFIIGHLAIKQIAHLESIELEWKRRKATEESKKVPGQKTATSELDQVTGTAEDEFSEAVARIRERELLHSRRSLLSIYGPIIEHICKYNLDFNVPILQVMAVMALCKLMCVSSEYCDANLQLLLTILEKSKNAIIRSNTIIGLGDLTVSFNSLIDQNISFLYNRLSDSDLTVKKNTLMVLTHLVLNGMVKVKGQISEMAKCLVDEDKRICDLARLFFTELSTKDNAVYNNLPDIISNLSNKETGVDEASFSSIMKFLLEFISKDKHVENVVEKLCLRFKNATEPRLWRDIGYCLSLLQINSERPLKKLMEALPYYHDKLSETSLYKNLTDIAGKAKKAAKGEAKALIEDYEKKLAECHEKCLENEKAEVNAKASKNPKKAEKSRPPTEDVAEVLASLHLNESNNDTPMDVDKDEAVDNNEAPATDEQDDDFEGAKKPEKVSKNTAPPRVGRRTGATKRNASKSIVREKTKRSRRAKQFVESEEDDIEEVQETEDSDG